jgi:DNA-binding transcriptional ArsR family regulator
MAQSDTDPRPQRRTETKQARLNNPSGWLYLTQHESVPILVDALLDWPTDREFTVQEFADHAGVVRQTVSKHLDVLLEVRLIEEVPETYPQRYRISNSPVTEELFTFNSAINAKSS